MKYKVAGVSKFKGSAKVRFANDMTRVKLLVKAGNTDINLIELPKEMTKAQVCTYLKTSELYKDPVQAEAIDNADAKYNPAPAVVKVKAPKAKATAKTPATAKAKAKPSLDAIKSRAKPAAKAPAAEVTAPAVETPTGDTNPA